MENTEKAENIEEEITLKKQETLKKVEKNEQLDLAVVLCLIGLPSSGKTYLATAIQKDTTFANLFTHIDIIDTDTIRINAFGENFQPENEPMVIEEKYNRIARTIKPG
ncbi:MAG: hypothetical protein ACTSYI_07640, partial [Promethearchaeota archaeon]